MNQHHYEVGLNDVDYWNSFHLRMSELYYFLVFEADSDLGNEYLIDYVCYILEYFFPKNHRQITQFSHPHQTRSIEKYVWLNVLVSETGFAYYYSHDYCLNLAANTIKDAIFGLEGNYYLIKALGCRKCLDR